jgi:hypothetical protein
MCQSSNDSERAAAAKGKARARVNSGSKGLMHALQHAFESNWPGNGSTNVPGTGSREMTAVVVVDHKEEEEDGKERFKITTPLDQVLAHSIHK